MVSIRSRPFICFVNIAWSTVRVNNKPITEFFTEEELEELGKKPAEGGFKVANGKGYTSYAIATCGVKLAQAVLSNAHFFGPVSTYVEEVGTYVGYPAIVGAKGVEKVVPLVLTDEEKAKLEQSANYIKEHLDSLK